MLRKKTNNPLFDVLNNISNIRSRVSNNEKRYELMLLQTELAQAHTNLKQILQDNDADSANEAGTYPIHLAAAICYPETVEILLDNEADVNCLNQNNKTPLQIAIENNNSGVVEVLLEHKLIQLTSDLIQSTTNQQIINLLKSSDKFIKLLEKNELNHGNQLSNKFNEKKIDNPFKSFFWQDKKLDHVKNDYEKDSAPHHQNKI